MMIVKTTTEEWSPERIQKRLEISGPAAQRLSTLAAHMRGRQVTLAKECHNPAVDAAGACEKVGEKPHPVTVLRITTINRACESLKAAIPNVPEFDVWGSLQGVLPHPSTVIEVGTYLLSPTWTEPNLTLALDAAMSDGLFGERSQLIAPELSALLNTPFWGHARDLLRRSVEDMLLLSAMVAIYSPLHSESVAAVVELAFADKGAVVLGKNHMSGNVFVLTHGPEDGTSI